MIDDSDSGGKSGSMGSVGGSGDHPDSTGEFGRDSTSKAEPKNDGSSARSFERGAETLGESSLESLRKVLDSDASHDSLKPLDYYARMFSIELEQLAREFIGRKDSGASNEMSFDLENSPAPFGRYLLIERIGRGGQGAVFRAQDTALRRDVALKILIDDPLRPTRTERIVRFDREASLMKTLDDPSICSVYDVGSVGRFRYIAMQLVPGETLHRRIQREYSAENGNRGLDILEFVGTVEVLSRAVHRAHDLGIVHRDIKPENIMLRPEGRPVLLDFGLAAAADDDSLTVTGDRFGTPSYMSPEQVVGDIKRIDRRTDVWALGVVLYRGLTGVLPFEGVTHDEIYRAIKSDEPRDPRQIRTAIPRDLSVVVKTALEKDLNRRYQTALDLANELQRVLNHQPTRARAAGIPIKVKRWCQRNPALAWTVGLFGIASVVGLAALTFLYVESRQSAEIQQQTNRRNQLLIHDLQSADLIVWDVELWPAVPEIIQGPRGMSAWLVTAERILGAIPDYRKLADDASGAVGAEYDHPEEARLHARRIADRQHALGSLFQDMQQRRDLAQFVGSLETTYADRWRTAIDTIRDESVCPHYRGLVIRPQRGLIPLRLDPTTKLYEFLCVVDREFSDPDARQPLDALIFVLLPGGRVRLGSPVEETSRFVDGREDLREVSLEPFFLAKREVTQSLWLKVMRTNPSFVRPGSHPRYDVNLNHPVENISKNNAIEFVRRLDLELPTTDQWEYAARAGTTWTWTWGIEADDLEDNENLYDRSSARKKTIARPDSVPVPWDDKFPIHAPVGSFPENPFGLSDMLGNVSEHCRRLSNSGKAEFANATLCGGSWQSTPMQARCATVVRIEFADAIASGGVRPARPLR